jgi:hypothetical protein
MAYALGHSDSFGWVVGSIEYHPDIRLTLIDSTVAHRLSVVWLLPSPHENQL